MALCISSLQGTRFIKYDNVYFIKVPTVKDSKWIVSIVYFDNSTYDFQCADKENAYVRYNDLVQHVKEYYI